MASPATAAAHQAGGGVGAAVRLLAEQAILRFDGLS